jgi:membrane-associated phospholipid phosphatase
VDYGLMSDPSDSSSQSSRFTRRSVLRLAALSPFALAATAEAARPRVQGPVLVRTPAQVEPSAGDWRTWLVPSADSLLPPPPPSRSSSAGMAECQELLTLQAQRSDAIRALIQFWEPQGGIPQWSQILLDTIKATAANPVRAARALALVHTAMADAAIATWNAKFAFQRLQPAMLDPRLVSLSQLDGTLPTYPSEHAAAAAAAAGVLNYLFPGQTALVHGQRLSFDALANEAAWSRLWAGANYHSDMDAGLRIGQAVAALAVARGQNDGSGGIWSLAVQPGRLVGPAFWVPTPPANVFPPLEALAGTWKTWVLDNGSQLRPGTPPALQGTFPNPQFLAETAEVKQLVASLTPDQRQIVNFWADNAGTTFTPPGHWGQIATEQIVGRQVSTPRAARALALLGVGVADSAIACWDSKFTYWVLRPITAIRTLAGQPFYDPSFNTVIPTPPFPAYVSGHSTFSGASAAILSHLFPGGTVSDALGQRIGYDAAADQAALSRLYGGIHYRSDNDEGLVLGRQIAELVIRRAQSDGAG